MPIYEYVCRDCGHHFEKIVQRTAHPACPNCQSTSLEQQFSVFAVGGKGASLTSSEPAGRCGACGDPRGPGSCALD